VPRKNEKRDLRREVDSRLPQSVSRFMSSDVAGESRGVGRRATQSPEPHLCFSHTKHNCNSRPQRPKKWNCGKYTLIGSVNQTYSHHRFRCKSYDCGRCGPRKIRQVRKRIVQRALQYGLQRFLTLTLDPKKMKAGWGTQEKIAFLYTVWRKMRIYLHRKLRKSLVFIAVVELQGNGNPHLHLLVGSYIPKQWISTSWQALGGGWNTRIEYADVHRVAAYLSNYLTDDSLCDLPPGTRRFSTSRGLALFERKKGKGVWILVRPSIEYWRDHAVGVTAEQHETDPDAVRSLASFNALEVPSFLAARLQGIDAPKLSVEVQPRRKGF
jgi:hypothetical protein